MLGYGFCFWVLEMRINLSDCMIFTEPKYCFTVLELSEELKLIVVVVLLLEDLCLCWWQ